MAFVTATVPIPLPDEGQHLKRWYSVLHTFRADGRHLETIAVFAGTAADGEIAVVERAEATLQDLLGRLGPLEYRDVQVCLFDVQVDGETFGLVDASEPAEDYEAIELLPNDYAFFAPWDGYYDT